MGITPKWDFNSRLQLGPMLSPDMEHRRIFYVEGIIQRYLRVLYEIVDIEDETHRLTVDEEWLEEVHLGA